MRGLDLADGSAATQQRLAANDAARSNTSNVSPEYKPTPLSQIKGFPIMSSTSPSSTTFSYGPNNDSHRRPGENPYLGVYQVPPEEGTMFAGDGFNGPESFALPQVGRVAHDEESLTC